MKLRALMLVLGALVVVGIIVFVARNTRWEEVSVPAPLRGEALTNPFYASQKLAEALGATTERRLSLGTLNDEVDTLVLSNWHWDLIEQRRAQIKAWVEAGGHLVVDNSLIGGDDFGDWSGIGWDRHFRPIEDEDENEDEDGGEDDDTDVGEEDDGTVVEEVEPPFDADDLGFDVDVGICGTLEEVDSEGKVLADGRKLSVCRLEAATFLAADGDITWGFAHNGVVQAARVDVGRGAVTALNARPFGNRNLTVNDHGILFVGATDLRVGDRIVFLSEQEHMSLLGLIWLHGAPVVMLALAFIAAALWRGWARFGPLAAPTDTARRSLAEQIRGTGQFAMRLGDGKALHAAAVRALNEAARKRIARYDSLPHEQRIAAIAKQSGLDPQALATAINHMGRRRTVELAHTIALLETARRRILE